MFLMMMALACTSEEPSNADNADNACNADWEAPLAEEIQLTTRDDVTLVADYYPQDTQGAPAVLLLHMNPVNFDRTGWPASFISILGDAGYTVLVPDRRGAGDSEGVATEAFTGEKGKWDVEACAKKLDADGYGELIVIGASNGTTSMIDYAAWAEGEDLPVPVALGFMTGGTYTEAQTDLSQVQGFPAIFTYSSAEKAWSVDQQDGAPGDWQFEEYADGDHGTKMFDAVPTVADDLLAWIEGL